MASGWRTGAVRVMVGVAVLSLGLLAGCAQQTQKGAVRPEPVQRPPEVVPAMPAPVSLEPSREDLAFEAAVVAESSGDPARAVALYESAAALATSDDRIAEIHFALAMLHADPSGVSRDLARSRSELQKVIDRKVEHARARDARIVAMLLDEMAQLRAQSMEHRAESDSLKGDLAALRARLDEKEKELAEIKKILLQDKQKP